MCAEDTVQVQIACSDMDYDKMDLAYSGLQEWTKLTKVRVGQIHENKHYRLRAQTYMGKGRSFVNFAEAS